MIRINGVARLIKLEKPGKDCLTQVSLLRNYSHLIPDLTFPKHLPQKNSRQTTASAVFTAEWSIHDSHPGDPSSTLSPAHPVKVTGG